MVRFVSGGLTLFALLTAVAASGSQRPEARSSEARCFTVWVRAEGGSGGQTRRFRRYAASELLDLRFQILLPSSQGVEKVGLKLYTPRGHLYQTLDIPVDAEPEEEAPAAAPVPLGLGGAPRRRHHDRHELALRPLEGGGVPRREPDTLRSGPGVHPRSLTV